MTIEQDIALGAQAKALWESQPFQNAIFAVKNGIIERWAKSPIADKEGQHELRLMLKIADDFEQNIISVINNGKMANDKLNYDAKVATMQKQGFRGSI